MKDKMQTKIDFEAIDVTGDVFGVAPVQAFGVVAGRDFYFRSKDGEWEFEVANESGDLPTDVGGDEVFLRRGTCSKDDISHSDALLLIEAAAREYLGLHEAGSA